jgi:hypothetical protein
MVILIGDFQGALIVPPFFRHRGDKMMLIKNPDFKVIEILINAKVEILMDRKTARTSGQKHPERDHHGKIFQLEKPGQPLDKGAFCPDKKKQRPRKNAALV